MQSAFESEPEATAIEVGMRCEKIASDDWRKRRVDDVEVDEVELVTSGCVSKATVERAKVEPEVPQVEDQV